MLICAGLTSLLVAACASDKPSDYDIELARFQDDIAALTQGAAPAAGGVTGADKAGALVHALYRRVSLTGSFADFKAAETAIDDVLGQVGPSPDLHALRAQLNLAFHRMANAAEDLRKAGAAAVNVNVRVRTLRADLDLQNGRFQEAEGGYEEVVRKNRSWDSLARLAHLRSVTGADAAAEALYVEAENEISAKEMRAYAWVKVQRGFLEFTRGRFEEASKHYQRADRAYSGYWFVQEHIAELLGAERRFDEAAALYERVIARAPKPELYQALGDLYAFMGKPDRARPWHVKALDAYLDSAQRGEVHYYHHLAGFYADVRQDGPEAVKWAQKDLELRHGPAAHDALAWALYRDGRPAEAAEEMDRALAPGVKDAHLFFHAAMIHLASGRVEEGRRFLRQAAEANPRFDTFHVHR